MSIRSAVTNMPDAVKMCDIKYGVLYTVLDTPYKGTVVLKASNDIAINLSNISKGTRWTSLQANTLMVQPLPVGAALTLTQEDL